MTCRLWLTSLLLLAGCATDPSVPARVEVPVPVPCIEKGKTPVRPQVCVAEPGPEFRLNVMRCTMIDRGNFMAYSTGLEAVLKACIKE